MTGEPARPTASTVLRFADAALAPSVAHGGHGHLLTDRAIAGAVDRPLRFVDLVEVPPGATVGQHTHGDDEEFYVIISGCARVDLDGASHLLRAGDVALNRPGGSHGLHVVGPEPVRMIVVCVVAAAAAGGPLSAQPRPVGPFSGRALRSDSSEPPSSLR